MAGSEQITHAQRADRIRGLNDYFRKRLTGGKLFLTSGILQLASTDTAELLHLVAGFDAFDAFDDDNDPHREHDFGSLSWRGERVFWKIDYYDPACRYGSSDPACPQLTTRVLTIMLASEY
ncbi:DUF3768 domain-containing protein [Paracoccus litorisediminis]|uniref:DUF3768 domain-containing protein n=1 Tax=Paracoccus litorisediminis TaxID=2006130 RepID=UPI00372E3BAC